MSATEISARTHRVPGFLASFSLHFVLPNVLLLLACLVSGVVGGEFGVTYLIWHDDPQKQFWVGFALMLVAMEALFVGFLLWTKKVGRPESLERYPNVLISLNPTFFAKYCCWVVGQLAIAMVVIAALVLLVQFVDTQSQVTVGPEDVEAVIDDTDQILPPRPNYSHWLPMGAAVAFTVIFGGGSLLKNLFTWPLITVAPGRRRPLLEWLIDSVEEDSTPRGGLLLALWDARVHGSIQRRLAMALFTQTLCITIGILFAAVWELSSRFMATGIAVVILGLIMTVRARWLMNVRVFRIFLLLLGVLVYFIVTWLGSKSWCGWYGAFFFGIYVLAIFPVGLRYAFPDPVARLLKSTKAQIIDPMICRRYPFHAIATAFFLFGTAMLFVVPMSADTVRSPMVLASFLIFMVVAIYGFVAYVVDDALPFLAPALIIMVVLSGLPRYKMQFPGLSYTSSSEAIPLLDLEATVAADAKRQQVFDEAVAQSIEARSRGFVTVARKKNPYEEPVLADREADCRWAEMEQENRILPGKDLRPGRHRLVPSPHSLLVLDQIDFNSVSPTIEKLKTPVPANEKVKKPMVIVVASGGGIRAAVWTFLVMAQLEERFAKEGIPFPYHVRFITGASGGMLGASYYVQSLDAPSQMNWGAERHEELLGQQGKFGKLTDDWLTPIVERMVTNDIPAFFSPFSAHTDRGIALEQAWSKHLDGDLDISFKDLAEKERQGWCPSLIFSPMLVEDGRRLLISNLDMRYPASNDGHLLDFQPNTPSALLNQNRNYSHEAMELFRMFPESKSNFALSTAIRMSASFPYFSPAVPLPTRPRRRVVDAGYFDNYGVSLAASILFSKKNQDWMAENVSKVVIVQIRDGQSDDERRLQAIPDSSTRQKGPTSLLSRSVEEITSPIEGLTNGRVGTSSFRNDGLLELLSTYFAQQRGEPKSGGMSVSKRFFTVVNFEFPGHVSLSWHLSKGEIEQMKNIFSDPKRSQALNSKIDHLLEWWKSDVFIKEERPRNISTGNRLDRNPTMIIPTRKFFWTDPDE
jgi:predicted acylesterase/phospholipase RssA